VATSNQEFAEFIASRPIIRTAEQIAAGIEMLDAYKEFNIIDAIATAYVITPDEAFNMDYGTCKLKLMKMHDIAYYQHNYNNIMQQQMKQQR
jgi:hypothetical protein